jgi:hypothetical protein
MDHMRWMLVALVAVACESKDSNGGGGGANDDTDALTDPGFVLLADPLDEPEYYCADVPGHADTIQLDGPMQAHTCKKPQDDQLFRSNHPRAGQLYLEDHDVCVEAASAAAGATMATAPCDEANPLQVWTSDADGVIALSSDPSLCWVVGEKSEVAGGESHLRRDLALQPCDPADTSLKEWVVPGGGALGK